MRRSSWIPSVAVALLAVALHVRTLGFEFVFDDLHLVVNNAFLKEPWSPLTALAHHFWYGTPFGAAYYRPIVSSSLALNGHLLGWEPGGFHAVNVLLHAANAGLLLALARRLGSPLWAATCAASLFAVHPAAAWPVGSIVARVDLLPAFFILLAWLALAKRVDRSGAPDDTGNDATRDPAPGWGPAACCGLLFLLALLCKESAVAFLAVPILAMRRMRDGEQRPVAWPALVALGSAVGLCYVVRRLAGVGVMVTHSMIDPLTNPLAYAAMPGRLWSALALAGRYILYLAFPVRFSDPRNYLDTSTLPSPWSLEVLLALAVLLAWGAGILVLWMRRDRIALPLAFSLASFLPASNVLVPISSLYALNFLYMPLVGLCLAVAVFLGRRVPRKAGAILAAVAAAALSVLTYAETGIWRDGMSLFTAWTARFPYYSQAHSNLGVMLLDRGEPEAAIPPLRRSLEITEENAEGQYNLGVALLLAKKDKVSREEALAHLQRSARMIPDLIPPSRANSAKALLLLGRPAEAVTEAREALRLVPGMKPAMRNLAEALFQLERYDEAADVYAELTGMYPDDASPRSDYVVSLIHSGQLDRARAAIQEARRVFPDLAWFDFCLARVEAKAGRKGEALVLLETSLAKDPKTRDWLKEVKEFDLYRGSPEFRSILSSSSADP